MVCIKRHYFKDVLCDIWFQKEYFLIKNYGIKIAVSAFCCSKSLFSTKKSNLKIPNKRQ